MGEELVAKSLSKHFGGVKAVDSVNLCVRPGEVHGLIGPNGAGKSTVLSIISGFVPSDTGEIIYGDEVLTGLSPSEVLGCGVGRTFQEPSPLKGLSVLDNVLVGLHSLGKVGFFRNLVRSPAAQYEERSLRKLALEMLESFGLSARANHMAEDLSFGEQRFLEVARLSASGPDVLMLDEPAAGMGEVESKRLAKIIASLRDENKGILLVDHDMAFVFSICDVVTVMDAGKVIAFGPPVKVLGDEEVRKAYLGSSAKDVAGRGKVGN